VNGVLSTVCAVLFLATAPALLFVRFAGRTRMPWWLLGVLAALLGWVLANLEVHFYFKHLDDLLDRAGGVEGAPQDLIDRWQNDGAQLTFALLFGWLFGLVYLVPWLVAYAVFNAIRSAAARKRGAAM